MKIAIIVHGRFHVFDLARALLERGHQVTLLTNYPKWAVQQFGIPKATVRSFWLHGIGSRGLSFLPIKKCVPFFEAWFHQAFGSWAANLVKKEKWDVVLCLSGVGEETFKALAPASALRICHRGASPIRIQARFLREEEKRVGFKIDQPSPWIINREEREYRLADVIYVPSSFARDRFIEEGFPFERLMTIPLGVDVKTFRPESKIIEARCRRILSGAPLRILNVGTFSFRKGVQDFAEIIRNLRKDNCCFRFVGPIAPEAQSLVSEIRRFVTFVPKQPQNRLTDYYSWGDLFLFPTIEDGYAVVLAQASAAGLPILTTPNGAGRDLIRDGETGWILPIRAPETFVERLRWCNTHRGELAEMVWRIYNKPHPRSWSDVVADFEKLCNKAMKS